MTLLSAPTRPYGARLRLPSDLKLRGQQLFRKQGGVEYYTQPGPGSEYVEWEVPAIDRAQASGANMIKAGLGPAETVVNLGTTVAKLLDIAGRTLNLIQSRGMLAYLTLNGTGPMGTGLSQYATFKSTALTLAAFAEQYPCVVGLDLANESVDLGVYTPDHLLIEYMADLAPALREVTTIPLTVSTFHGYSESALRLLDPYVDFWDLHLYDPITQLGSPAAVLAPMRAISGKPWINGESGATIGGGLAGAVAKANQLKTWHEEPDCFGGVWWTIQDGSAFDAGDPAHWHMHDAAGAVRPTIEAAFRTWPARG